MTTLNAKGAHERQHVEPAPTGVAPASAPAVITEQQVLFSTAAALTPARKRTRAHAVTAAVRGWFTRPEKPSAPRHYPQRFSYLEKAAMSRAMDRL